MHEALTNLKSIVEGPLSPQLSTGSMITLSVPSGTSFLTLQPHVFPKTIPRSYALRLYSIDGLLAIICVISS